MINTCICGVQIKLKCGYWQHIKGGCLMAEPRPGEPYYPTGIVLGPPHQI